MGYVSVEDKVAIRKKLYVYEVHLRKEGKWEGRVPSRVNDYRKWLVSLAENAANRERPVIMFHVTSPPKPSYARREHGSAKKAKPVWK
jgi:hypothetical protein